MKRSTERRMASIFENLVTGFVITIALFLFGAFIYDFGVLVGAALVGGVIGMYFIGRVWREVIVPIIGDHL